MNNELNKITKSLIATFLGLLAGGILMLAIGQNPIAGYTFLFRGGLMSVERIGNTLAAGTTLILTGLSVAFAFRTGLFNIGAAGQMLMGGFFATMVGLTFEDWPRFLLLSAMLLAAMLGGGIWGFIPGFLKAKFNVNEVVATIMLNWTSKWIVYYTIKAYFIDNQETQSAQLVANASLKAAWLTDIFNDSAGINLGIFIAILAVILVKLIIDRTTLGYELKAVGYNRDAAENNGIEPNKNIILAMVISGMLAGLGGLVYYTGYNSILDLSVLPTTHGFDGIAVALLGATTPFGVLVAGLFFGLLHTGKGFMNAMTGIPPQIADTIIATIIYFTATSLFIQRLWSRYKKKKANATEKGGKK